MLTKEDIKRAVRESFDVVKVTDVILDEIQKALAKGFDLGVKAVCDAGIPKWHDICKNPEDLPTDKHFKITSDGDIAFYDCFLDKWYDLRSDELTYHPAAWCEIPRLE